MNPNVLEECYQKYIRDLNLWPSEIIEVNLQLLHQLDLLDFHPEHKKDSYLTQHFHLLEAEEKITLVNEQFVVWIVPDNLYGRLETYTLIALQTPNGPHLEAVLVTRGIYNNSRLVLNVLEKFLYEIKETEGFLRRITT